MADIEQKPSAASHPLAVNLRLLEVFLCVIEEGTMTGAAERLGLSQAAVSQAITSLEQLLGVRLFDRSVRPPALTLVGQAAGPRSGAKSAVRCFALGLSTQVSNPKAAIVYSSVFAAFLPASPTMEFNLSVAAMVFGIEAGWYIFVALALSANGPRSVYLRYKSWIDRVAGGVMVALGLKLVSAANRP